MVEYSFPEDLQDIIDDIADRSGISPCKVLTEAVICLDQIYNILAGGEDIVVMEKDGELKSRIELDIPVPGRVWRG